MPSAGKRVTSAKRGKTSSAKSRVIYIFILIGRKGQIFALIGLNHFVLQTQKLTVTIKYIITTFKPVRLWQTAVMMENSFRCLNSPSLILWKIFSPVENAQGEPDNEMLDKFHEYQEKAEIYHLYHSIQRYTVSCIKNGTAGAGFLWLLHQTVDPDARSKT